MYVWPSGSSGYWPSVQTAGAPLSALVQCRQMTTLSPPQRRTSGTKVLHRQLTILRVSQVSSLPGPRNPGAVPFGHNNKKGWLRCQSKKRMSATTDMIRWARIRKQIELVCTYVYVVEKVAKIRRRYKHAHRSAPAWPCFGACDATTTLRAVIDPGLTDLPVCGRACLQGAVQPYQLPGSCPLTWPFATLIKPETYTALPVRSGWRLQSHTQLHNGTKHCMCAECVVKTSAPVRMPRS
jgi:hypothetical protein